MLFVPDCSTVIRGAPRHVAGAPRCCARQRDEKRIIVQQRVRGPSAPSEPVGPPRCFWRNLELLLIQLALGTHHSPVRSTESLNWLLNEYSHVIPHLPLGTESLTMPLSPHCIPCWHSKSPNRLINDCSLSVQQLPDPTTHHLQFQNYLSNMRRTLTLTLYIYYVSIWQTCYSWNRCSRILHYCAGNCSAWNISLVMYTTISGYQLVTTADGSSQSLAGLAVFHYVASTIRHCFFLNFGQMG